MWLITFQNGKFGAFAASTKKCSKGQVRLAGKCRPALSERVRLSNTAPNFRARALSVRGS